MTPSNADLRQFIIQFFNDEELETLCFDYFPDVNQNFSAGMTKNRKAIGLIAYCETRGRLDDLYAALERERPKAWKERFGGALVETGRRPVSTPERAARDPRQVFLSHATTDAEFAHRLKDDLEAEGWRVWIAPDSIRAGEKWVEAINRGLEESGVFVVALTPEAVASRWVTTETNAAIDLYHVNEIRFITLDVKACTLPVLWRQFQYIPFRKSYEAHGKTTITLGPHIEASPFPTGGAATLASGWPNISPRSRLLISDLAEFWGSGGLPSSRG